MYQVVLNQLIIKVDIVLIIYLKKVKKNIQMAKNFWLIYDYSSEGDIRPHIFKELHKARKRNKINPSKVIVITSSENTFDIYKQYLNEHPQENLFYTIFILGHC